MPISDAQSANDATHLRILSICYFVKAGMGAVGLLFTVAWFFLMRALLSDPSVWGNAKVTPMPKQMFFFYEAVIIVIVVFAIVMLAANVLAGIFLTKRRHRVACTVIGGLNCLSMPLGTVLGVFTILVLGRPSVMALFHRER